MNRAEVLAMILCIAIVGFGTYFGFWKFNETHTIVKVVTLENIVKKDFSYHTGNKYKIKLENKDHQVEEYIVGIDELNKITNLCSVDSKMELHFDCNGNIVNVKFK